MGEVTMAHEWSKLAKEVVLVGLAFGLGLAPWFMGYAPVALGMIAVIFGYVVLRLWKERI